MEKHSCCEGHGGHAGNHAGHNYAAYIIGAVILLIVVLLIANNALGTGPVNNGANAVAKQCGGMINNAAQNNVLPAGMSQEEHESHHR
ncbi:hypothetical protein HY485_03245 [Candidatus Woesearchaeota archaeon]|nr:hypothetical protein [Candidatus Woesearchaeota archaeon]